MVPVNLRTCGGERRGDCAVLGIPESSRSPTAGRQREADLLRGLAPGQRHATRTGSPDHAAEPMISAHRTYGISSSCTRTPSATAMRSMLSSEMFRAWRSTWAMKVRCSPATNVVVNVCTCEFNFPGQKLLNQGRGFPYRYTHRTPIATTQLGTRSVRSPSVEVHKRRLSGHRRTRWLIRQRRACRRTCAHRLPTSCPTSTANDPC
jgi:hypothetical protein